MTTAPAYDNADFKFVKRVDEVNLRFTVTDSHGHFQNQLTAEDFQVLDNHQPPAAIRYFQQQSTLPMRVGILIDVSGSVALRFKFEQKAASVFLQKVLRPDYDEAFFVTFDQKVHLLEDWTSDSKTAFDKAHPLRSEYVVGYQPTQLKLDGSFCLVEIRPHKSN
jgi:VWFA-related protein